MLLFYLIKKLYFIKVEEQSSIDDHIHKKTERMPSIIYEQPIQLLHYHSDSSDRNTDYDSSIEDSI